MTILKLLSAINNIIKKEYNKIIIFSCTVDWCVIYILVIQGPVTAGIWVLSLGKQK